MGKGKIKALESLALIIGLPTAGIPSSLYEWWNDYKSVSLNNKVNSFLTAIDTMSEFERDSFSDKILANKNFKSDVIYVLIDIIDKTFADSNIDVLANLSFALAKGSISSDDFFRSASVVRNILYTDLLDLENYNNNDEGGYASSESFTLLSNGLVYISVYGGDNILFLRTELGRIILKFGLKSEF